MGFLTSLSDLSSKERAFLSPSAAEDLMLSDYFTRLFDFGDSLKPLPWEELLTFSEEEIHYRRDILRELKAFPEIPDAMSEVCKCLSQMKAYAETPASDEFMAESMREFAVLRLAYTTMKNLRDQLSRRLSDGALSSAGLQRLLHLMDEKLRNNFAEDFLHAFDKHAGGLDEPGSLRIRFTLNGELQTEGAALTHIERELFARSGLGAHVEKQRRHELRPSDLQPLRAMRTPAETLLRSQLTANQRLFLRTISSLLSDLEDLHHDLRFYLGALRYIRQMEKTMTPLCYAKILPTPLSAFSCTELYNPILTVYQTKRAVPSDISFAENGELLILTGINQGGKTTFLRSVGVAQVFTQLGWPVAAKTASLSLADKVITVFSHEENTHLEHGKLGQELKAIREGLNLCTEKSLLLCNEPITGTSPMENLYLSKEVLASLKLLRAHGIWVTHIYDLASGADEMNASLPGSAIGSLIAVAEKTGSDVSPSFHVKRGAPQFISYAKEVLQKQASL